MKKLFLLALFAILFSFITSCVDNNTDPEPDNTVKTLMPLKVGNQWVYQYYYYDSITEFEETWTLIDAGQRTWQKTIYIIGNVHDSIIGTMKSFRFNVQTFKNSYLRDTFYAIRNDSLFVGVYDYSDTGKIQIAYSVPDTGVIEDGNHGFENDGYYSTYSTYQSEIGNLDGCKIYSDDLYHTYFSVYSKGIGIIQFVEDNASRRLKSYTLK